MKKSTQNVRPYFWGDGGQAWRLVDAPTLSVIEEKIPSGASERLHFHERAQQFFYILDGSALFEIDGEQIEVNANEGLSILKNQKHLIKNIGKIDLRFLVISQPTTREDRKNL